MTAIGKEKHEYYTSIERAVHQLGWSDLALRENYDDDNPLTEDIIYNRNFKELFNVTYESNSRLQEMLMTRQKNATFTLKTTKNLLLYCIKTCISV